MSQFILQGQGPTSSSFPRQVAWQRATMRLIRRLCIYVACSMAWTPLIAGSVMGQTFSPTAQWGADANLNDVFFIDADVGWAVGDRGVILLTEDGGRSWIKAKSPVQCTLESVFFLNAQDGWVVGGYARPITHMVGGVVLRTTDGGQSWRRVAAESMPWMHQIVMETEQRGWAHVTRSAWAPAGIVLTDDGGSTWRPFAGNVEGEWTDAARLGPSVFAVVGRDKTAALSRRGDLEEAIVVNPGRFDLTSMAMVDAQYGWAVGTYGTVTMTQDGGHTWDIPSSPRTPPEPRISRHFDWQTVVAMGNHVWIAGSPGTRIAHSADQGRTWTWTETGTSLPIRSLSFWNEQRGWAVGDGGIVLSTMDGGRSWRVMRNVVDRVAVLGIYDRVEDVPLELFARYAGSDGYFASVAVTEIAPLAGLHDSPSRDRLRQCLSEVGVSGLSWARLNPYLAPSPSPTNGSDVSRKLSAPRTQSRPSIGVVGDEQSSRPLSSTRGGENASVGTSNDPFPSDVSRGQLKEYLVRLVRQWRPDVIISDTLESRTGNDTRDFEWQQSSGELTNQLLSEVFADAADPNAYRDQLTEAGLQVWSPSKLYVRATRETRVDEMLATNQFSPRLGTSLEDYCLTQNGLIKVPELDPEIRPGWVLHASTLANAQAHRSLLSGINPQALAEVRRSLVPPGPGNLGVMQRQARKWEWIERVMVTTHTANGDSANWQREVDRLLIGLDELGKGNALFQVALEHEDRGQYEAAARAMHQIVTDCKQHPFWDAAMVWLVRYYASAEAKWRLDPDARVPHIQLAAFDEAIEEGARRVELAGQDISTVGEDPIQVPYSLQQLIRDQRIGQVLPQDRSSHARNLWQILHARHPRVAELASLQMAMSAMNRRTRGISEVSSEAIVAARYASPPWQHVGQIESWLRDGQEGPPVPVIFCQTTQDPPTLDGALNDPLWESTPEIALELLDSSPSSTKLATSMRIARDMEFLYLAFECETRDPIKPLRDIKTKKDSDNSPSRPDQRSEDRRRRDQSLTEVDRIWMAIDVDRDYATAFSLEIDAYGRPKDMALESIDWDPQWFVAHQHQQQGWTLEIAIPFSQLQEVPPRNREAWGFVVRRIPAGKPTPVGSRPLFASPRPESILLFSE